MTRKITVVLRQFCWFAWYGDQWYDGDPLGRGLTKEIAIYMLQCHPSTR